KFNEQWLTEVANELLSKPGASLVLAGSHQPVAVQFLAYAINSALKNIGATLIVREFARNSKTNSILQLAGEISSGRIKQLFIFGGDPVYNAPRAITQDREKGPVDWTDLQKRVPDVVRLGHYEDATSELSNWHVPAAHYLEAWGDALTFEGAYLAIQPMILPLFGGLSEIELMNALLGAPKVEGPELVQETFRATAPPGDFAAAWSRLLRDGFATHVELKDKTPTFNSNNAGGVAHTLWGPPPAPTPDSPEVVLVRSYAMDDGRYINNGWLQELPDPITKLTWDNAALISPAFATHLGVESGDLLRVSITDAAHNGSDQPIKRELIIAALVSPGHADNSVTIPLGYGRKMPGFDYLPYAGGAVEETARIADQTGFNGYLLRTTANTHFAVADGKEIQSVKIEKAGGKYALS